MQAATLRPANAYPRQQIGSATEGNFCRCATESASYHRTGRAGEGTKLEFNRRQVWKAGQAFVVALPNYAVTETISRKVDSACSMDCQYASYSVLLSMPQWSSFWVSPDS